MTEYDNSLLSGRSLKRLGGRKPFSAKERFEASYVPVTESGCWLWIASPTNKGYGRIKSNGKTYSAHRFSWMEKHGEIPNGMYVCHKCDTPSCVNPDHLFIGSCMDNVIDMVVKNRNSKGLRHSESIKKRNVGESNHKSVLTTENVISIRLDKRPQRAIAREYQVSQCLVSNIKLNKTWSHV